MKRILVVNCLMVFTLSLAGCATGRKQNDLQMQGLRNQISALEMQIQAKDDEINNLKESLSQASQTSEVTPSVQRHGKTGKKRVIAEVKSRPNIRQIQTALQNAGYDPGTIDGRMGRQTRDAIKAFQAANNISADGKVGKQTWRLLSVYLYKKIK
jgi:outer membrane murein-binding lipoprotein Lpp